MLELYPSLLAADPLKLGLIISELAPICAGFHLDLMDNHLVPNLAGGPDLVNAIVAATKHSVSVHLMITDPISVITRLNLRSSDTVLIHSRTAVDALKIVATMRTTRNCKVGIVINPDQTMPELLAPILPVDQVLLMAVTPGFSGQSFQPTTYAKLGALVNWRRQQNLNFTIGVDGGVNADNIVKLANLGADSIIIGSALFTDGQPLSALQKLRQLLNL